MEVGRRFLIQCQVDGDVIPTAFGSSFRRLVSEQKRGVSTDFSIRVLFNNGLTKSDEGDYICDALSSKGETREMFRVNVLGEIHTHT